MAGRTYAQIHLTINIDDEFNDLDADEQALYFRLLAAPRMLHCGVAGWHPGKFAAKVRGWTAAKVREIATRLADRSYVVIDDDTEEILIRSHMRYDGLLRSVKSGQAVVQSVLEVASSTIRRAVLAEMARMRRDNPDWGVWNDPANGSILQKMPVDTPLVEADTPSGGSDTPSGGSDTPSGGSDTPSGGSDTPSDTPSDGYDAEVEAQEPITNKQEPTTNKPSSVDTSENVTTADASRKRGRRLPEAWMPSDAVRSWARGQFPHLDLQVEHDKFTDYWRSKSGRDATKVDWDATWRNWIRTAAERAPTHPGRVAPSSPAPSTTNQRVAAGLALAARYESGELE